MSGIHFSGCTCPSPTPGSSLTLCLTTNTGPAKPTLPVSAMTRLMADGDCKSCGGEQSFYVRPITGWLVEWCGKCMRETIVDRRQAPRGD
jgi:hypothetical protein